MVSSFAWAWTAQATKRPVPRSAVKLAEGSPIFLAFISTSRFDDDDIYSFPW
jgi:hypothetical protein